MGLVLPDRREALVRLGLAMAAVLCSPRGSRARGSARADGEVALLAARIRDASRDGAWDAAGQAIRGGASPETLLGAVFLAGVEDIRPRPHGILHAAMMAESACQLADAGSSRRAAWHPALFNLDDLKTAQEEDRAEWGDYRMKPLASAPRGTPEAARRELVAALDAFDPERAERAAAALAALVDAESCFELLRPVSVRCHAFIGHKAIYAVQVERMLRRVGWEHAEPALRSLVLAMLVGRETEGYERALDLSRGLPPLALARGGDAEDLFRALRAASPAEAQGAMAAALRAGLGAPAAWDAVLLVGADVFQRRPGRRSADGRGALLPVHAVTVASALRSSFEAARDDVTKRLLLLQAAAWVARVRDALGQIVGLSMEGPSLAAASARPPTLDAAVESASPALAMAFLERDASGSAALVGRMRGTLARAGREHHQHKLAAALGEEAGRVAPGLRPRLVAPAVDYLANPRDADTDVFRRAERLLDAAEVRS
jgi:hypothetical protein